MKFPGIAEILLILLIAFIVILVVRITNMSQSPRKAKKRRPAEYSEDDEYETSLVEEPKKPVRRKLIVIGTVVILIGITMVLASFDLLRLIILAPIGGAIAIIAGAAVLFWATQRR